MRGLWSAALVVARCLCLSAQRARNLSAFRSPRSIVVTVTKSDQRMVVTVDGQPRFKWCGLDRRARLCDAEWQLQGELARRAPQIEAVQRRADALCDFLR